MKAYFETGELDVAEGNLELSFDFWFKPPWCFLEVSACNAHCGGVEKNIVEYEIHGHRLTLLGIINSPTAHIHWCVLGG
jgi:hypothetical protein